jgi:chloramphenicol 3-O phosphotransferase
VLLRRERKDRTLGQAAKQHDLVHAHRIYDLEVDTSLLNPQECAERIRERIEAGPPQAFKKLFKAQPQDGMA